MARVVDRAEKSVFSRKKMLFFDKKLDKAGPGF
jgi:hypothetical protein